MINDSKLPWNKIKELTANDDDKDVMLANRTEDILLTLGSLALGFSQI